MEAAKEKLNEEAIEKKLKSFNNSQDSVQAVSLWIMHHKAQHRKIVDTWLKVMRASKYISPPTDNGIVQLSLGMADLFYFLEFHSFNNTALNFYPRQGECALNRQNLSSNKKVAQV